MTSAALILSRRRKASDLRIIIGGSMRGMSGSNKARTISLTSRLGAGWSGVTTRCSTHPTCAWSLRE